MVSSLLLSSVVHDAESQIIFKIEKVSDERKTVIGLRDRLVTKNEPPMYLIPPVFA